jgi:predicted nucleic acid-binding protein
VILIDTSVWADHFRKSESLLTDIGRSGALVMHPFVVGELAAGYLPQWEQTVSALRLIPAVAIVADDDFFVFLHDQRLMGSGLSFVDLHLLASISATKSARLWSRDKRLNARAEEMGFAYAPR